ncbi:hypothetical protein BCR35DRAFT_352652 [Leucosporidium creatinivorum]|uniref:Zn(2)-C6 fungal-type domain-containing protein n=1 Tax=Leucosporidium creatinivorum TaxID=106004 RepID=A0A1Y2F8S2_9BASI|nr:hypothetical protein BCR35DRAFT_352652 [Leucosporidium creatinivorum]
MEAVISGIRTAIANIDAALKEEHYVRPSRVKPTPLPTRGSCSNCKRAKAKCRGESPNACPRCTEAGLAHECTYPIQARPGRKQGVNKRSILLNDTRAELVRVLQLLDPSSTAEASPAASTPTSTPLAPPALPLPSLPTLPVIPTVAAPLQSAPRLPQPSSSKLTLDHLNAIPSLSTFNISATTTTSKPIPSPIVASRFQPSSGPVGPVLENDALEGIDNPLAVLAHVSLHDKDTDKEDFAYAMQEESDLIDRAERYYSTGLYTAIDDTDGELDPVSLGLLTERDLRRLVNLYFTKLRPFFFHFSAALHTPDFFRNVSPFLCTSFAYITATYCPQSSHLVTPLRKHFERLSTRVLADGYKSPEIVQGYLLLSHWAPAAETWCQDRSWMWLGEALRIATEINMSKELSEERLNDYRARTPLTPKMIELLKESCSRTWHLLWSGNLMLSVHSGRIVGKSFIGGEYPHPDAREPSEMLIVYFSTGLRSALPLVEPSHPNYAFSANEILNRIFANALNLASRLEDKPLADSYAVFNRSWRLELEQWCRDWPAINHFLWIRYWNVRIMLLSLSLKFGPPTKPVLEEVSGAALATLGKVHEWAAEGESIIYASNSAITNIAFVELSLLSRSCFPKPDLFTSRYGATILLKIISSSDPTRDPNLKTVVLDLCSKVVDTLFRIGDGRANSPSMATLQAARMQSLLRTINPVPTPAPLQLSDPIPLSLPFTFPSPSATTPNLGFEFTAGDFQFNSDTSNFFEDFSSSGLLSMMGQQQSQDQTMASWGGWDQEGSWPLDGSFDFGRAG